MAEVIPDSIRHFAKTILDESTPGFRCGPIIMDGFVFFVNDGEIY